MKKSHFEELRESVQQAGRIKKGKARASRRSKFKPLDVREIRERIGLSQSRFAMLLGISLSTLQNWEQGRRTPEGPAQALLRVAERHPEALLDSLATK